MVEPFQFDTKPAPASKRRASSPPERALAVAADALLFGDGLAALGLLFGVDAIPDGLRCLGAEDGG